MNDNDEEFWRFQKTKNFYRYSDKDYQTYYIFNKKYWSSRLYINNYKRLSVNRTQNFDGLEFILAKEGKSGVKIIDRRNRTIQQNFERCGTQLQNNTGASRSTLNRASVPASVPASVTDTWNLVKEGNNL